MLMREYAVPYLQGVVPGPTRPKRCVCVEGKALNYNFMAPMGSSWTCNMMRRALSKHIWRTPLHATGRRQGMDCGMQHVTRIGGDCSPPSRQICHGELNPFHGPKMGPTAGAQA